MYLILNLYQQKSMYCNATNPVGFGETGTANQKNRQILRAI